jgi:putative redox protein
MADAPITARISESGASRYAVTIDVAGHSLVGDEPADFGGADLGPNPFAYLTAALGECTAMTIRWYAVQQNWPLEHVEVTVTHRKGGEGTVSPRQDLFEKEIRITAPELSADQIAKLREISAKCPVQRTLEGSPLIRTLA